MNTRPLGVSLIAVWWFIGGGLLVVAAIMTFASGALLGGTLSALGGAFGNQAVSYVWLLASLLAVFAVLEVWVGYGLWQLQDWARIATIALAALLFVLSIPALIVTIPLGLVFGVPVFATGAQAAVEGVIVWYLLQDRIVRLFQGGYDPSLLCPNPNCGRPVEPYWAECRHCGYSLRTIIEPIDPPTPPPIPSLPPTEVFSDGRAMVSAWFVDPRSANGRQYTVQRDMEIGRDPARCQIVLNDGKVGRAHAKLLQEGRVYYLLDLGSVNGTYVNGRKIDRKTLLSDDDEVRFGETVLVFKQVR